MARARWQNISQEIKASNGKHIRSLQDSVGAIFGKVSNANSIGDLVQCDARRVRDVTGQPDYQVIQATPTSITIEFQEGERAQAQGRAADHCRQYHRSALMLTVEPKDGGSAATFSCT